MKKKLKIFGDLIQKILAVGIGSELIQGQVVHLQKVFCLFYSSCLVAQVLQIINVTNNDPPPQSSPERAGSRILLNYFLPSQRTQSESALKLGN